MWKEYVRALRGAMTEETFGEVRTGFSIGRGWSLAPPGACSDLGSVLGSEHDVIKKLEAAFRVRPSIAGCRRSAKPQRRRS